MADYTQLIRREGLSQQYTPDELLLKFQAYVAFNATNTWYKNELVRFKNTAMIYQVPQRVPLTTKAFCLYALMSHTAFMNYMNPLSTTYAAYNEVATYIFDSCAVDLFNGSVIGAFNGNLAAAMIKKSFGVEDDEETRKGGKNVDTIRHEIEFVDYTDVTHDPLPPHDPAAIPEAVRLQLEKDASAALPVGAYDNKPNYSSTQDDMEAFKVRNGLIGVQED